MCSPKVLLGMPGLQLSVNKVENELFRFCVGTNGLAALMQMRIMQMDGVANVWQR